MPDSCNRIRKKQRRLPTLFTIGDRRRDQYSIFLISGIALFILSANSEAPLAEFRGEKGRSYPCELVKISDGDTVIARCAQQKIHIRLIGIDAPEIGQQPYGAQAREALRKRLPRHFNMHYRGQDYYHRSLGILYDIGRDINYSMIADGYAFAYAGKDTPSAYRQAEKKARRYRKGFWAAQKPPDNPKTWRRHHQ